MGLKLTVYQNPNKMELLTDDKVVFLKFLNTDNNIMEGYTFPIDKLRAILWQYIEDNTNLNHLSDQYEVHISAKSAPKVYTPDLVLGKLKYWRKKLKLSLRQVEEKTGISNSYLFQLENGKIDNPSFDFISRLLKLYEIKIHF